MTRFRKITAGTGMVLIVLVIVGLAWAALDTHHPRPSTSGTKSTTAIRPRRHPSPSLPASARQWVPVPPATTVPPQTPVQLQYDSQFESGLTPAMPGIEAAGQHMPAPAYAGGWELLPVSYQPEQWVTQFTAALLGIDFAHQSRTGLAAWAVANEAPEMVPGVVPWVQNTVLYVSLFDQSAAGGTSSPIPSTDQWQANASSGVVWSVSQLLIEMDPQWSQIVASGWEPTDTRFCDYDVSGILTVNQPGQPNTTLPFSMQIYVGSAHWHQGYGTVSVSGWSES